MPGQERNDGRRPTERGKVRGGRTSKRGVPVIDLLGTGEGRRDETAKTLDPDALVADIRAIAELGRKVNHVPQGRRRR